jgi:hypothetical protein
MESASGIGASRRKRFRSTPWVALAILLIAVLPWASQVVVVRPYCSDRWLRTADPWKPMPDWAEYESQALKVYGPLSDAFADSASAQLREWGARHLRLGNFIFVHYQALRPAARDNTRYGLSYLTLSKLSAPVFSTTWLTMPEDIRRRLEERGSTPPGCDAATLGDPFRDPSAWEIKRCEDIAVFRRVDDDCDLVRALALKNWGRD